MNSRRKFLKDTAKVGSTIMVSPSLIRSLKSTKKVSIACQQYPWHTFFQRAGTSWEADIKHSVSQVNQAGFQVFEPTLASTKEANPLRPWLTKNEIRTPSLYVNSELHELDKVDSSIRQVLEIAKIVRPWGVKILVTNPSPIRWGGEEDKSDQQLLLQAKSLNQLGAQLRKLGLILAYHSHDTEMRNSAREFHHMMLGTDPENVRLCLDAHWIFRGAGNSEVALFDIAKLYMDRIVELHIRQSREGIWTEAFCPGDIDYSRLAEFLLSNQKKPPLVLEQAVEKESPNTMDALKAHQKSLKYALKVFAEFAD